MKKTLIALAALASTAAFAQSTANITGTFGAGYQSYKAAGVVNKGLTMTDSTISVAVSEDLGGGLRAAANVNLAGNASRGGNVTKEDSAVSLSGGFGAVAVMNTRSSNAAIGSQVFASSMPVTSFYAGVDRRAAGDALVYTSPELMAGLKVSFTHFEATEGDVTSAGKANILGATYAAGPLAAAVAFKSYNSAAQATAGAVLGGVGEKSRTEGFVTYDLGMAKLGLGFGTKRTSTDKNLTALSVNAPLGAINVGLNYAKRGTNKFYEAGAKYSVSKRTTANVMFGKLTGGNNAGNQYRVGVVHTF